MNVARKPASSKYGKVLIAFLGLRGGALGGGQHEVFSTAEALSDAGFKVSLLCSAWPNFSKLRRELGVKIPVHEMSQFNFQGPPLYSGFLKRVIHPLRVPAIKVRLYINFDANDDPFLVPLNSLFNNETPLVYYFISTEVSRLWNRKIKSYWKFYNVARIKLIDRLIKRIRENGLFIAICKYTARKVEAACGVRPKILYGSINWSTYGWRGEKKEDFMVSMGRLHPYKRYEYAILAAKAAQKKLIILGAPSDEEYHRKLVSLIRRIGIQDRVKIIVGLSSEERASLLRRAKVFLHCSIEGFGKAVAEAMAAGCVPVVPKAGGQSEYSPKEFQYSSFDEMLQKTEEAFNAPSTLSHDVSEKVMEFDLPRYKSRFINLLKEEQLI